MKRAIVLSGGGAMGAFEVGALKYMREHRQQQFSFDIIAGVSVGSLNGALLAQNEFDRLLELWNTLSNKKVYTGKMNLLNILWRVVIGRKSILGIEPLIRQIQKSIDITKIKTDFRFSFVSLTSGEYVCCTKEMFGLDNHNFRRAILASCTMPVIWEPVKDVKTGDKVHTHLVDGGIKNTSPLGDVMSSNPDEIILITCFPTRMPTEVKAAKTIFSIAKRSITQFTTFQVFRDEVESFQRINKIVSQCEANGTTIYKDRDKTKPYKSFNAIVIEPEEELGDLLDFSQEQIQLRMRAGFVAAEKAFAEADRDVNVKRKLVAAPVN